MAKVFTLEEVATHNKESDMWLIYNGDVYDVTAYLPEHPGGIDIIADHGGSEATSAFDTIGHSDSARATLKKYLIGTLSEEDKEKAKGGVKSNRKESSTGVAIGIAVVIFASAIYFVLG